MIKNTLCLILLTSTLSLLSMAPEQDGIIEINGAKHTMIDHVYFARAGKRGLFSYALIIRYDKRRHAFIKHGTINDSLKPCDLLDITNHNYVFIPAFTICDAPNKKNARIAIDALVTGTRDPLIANQIDSPKIKDELLNGREALGEKPERCLIS